MIGVMGTLFFLFASERAGTTTGANAETSRFVLTKGEGLWDIATALSQKGLISGRISFALYALRTGQYKNFQAGEYTVTGTMTMKEIVDRFTAGKIVPPGVRITFPEGWTAKDMAKRLTANNLPGDEFLRIVTDPFPVWRERYPFLADLPLGMSLEGYLFPDTYIFPEQATGELIVGELLKTFDKRFSVDLRTRAKEQGLSLHELVTLASIVEGEVPTAGDRRLVADIFLRRLSIGQALESCATLAYILGERKMQYSIEETQVESPYNTYQNQGLPPGPIGNPGLAAIEATLNPLPNPYFFFLSNPETGETVYSRTFEEHLQNKAKHGL